MVQATGDKTITKEQMCFNWSENHTHVQIETGNSRGKIILNYRSSPKH